MKKSTNSPNILQENDTQKHTASFREEFSKLNEDLQTILHHVKSSGAEWTKDVSLDVRSRIESIAERIGDINKKVGDSAGEFINAQLARTKEKTQEYADDLEATIKAHPIASVTVSFGVGLLISKVLGSCQSSH